MDSIGDAVSVADEVQGFRYFDDRDVIGFVDGTENPRGGAAQDAAIVGDEDPGFAGGSYVIVQKYLHDMKGWNALPVETQERIVGQKLSDIELKDAEKPAYAHNELTTIEENGRELKILRDNMPFGRPGHGEFGTYFIGYSRTPRITKRCSTTCSWAADPATTTACSISASQLPEVYFSRRHPRFSTTSAEMHRTLSFQVIRRNRRERLVSCCRPRISTRSGSCCPGLSAAYPILPGHRFTPQRSRRMLNPAHSGGQSILGESRRHFMLILLIVAALAGDLP